LPIISAHAQIKEDTLFYNIKFHPSFLAKAQLKIFRSGNYYYSNFKLFDNFKDTICLAEQTVLISDSSIQQLKKNFSEPSNETILKNNFEFVEDGDTFRYNMKNLDGITVYGKYLNQTHLQKFVFWSPEKGSRDYKISENIFNLLNTNFVENTELVKYIENIEEYFDFGLGVKQLSTKPLRYKLFGTITGKQEKELNDFLKALPTNEKNYLDLSHLTGIDPSVFPLFKKYTIKNSNIFFINPNHCALVELHRMGIKEENIIGKEKLIRVTEKTGQITYKFIEKKDNTSID